MAPPGTVASKEEAKAKLRQLFWQSGNVKVFGVALFAAVPILSLWYFNTKLFEYARPKVLEAREWILGRPDYENEDLRRALGLKVQPNPAAKRENIFDYSNLNKEKGQEGLR